MLLVLTQFIFNRLQSLPSWWMVVCAIWSWQYFGPAVVLPIHLGFFSILENKLYGYTYDFTLVAVVPSPIDKVGVSESLNFDHTKVSEWCVLIG